MFDLIDRVRQKSDKQKKIIAFSVSLSFCLIIFTFWIFTVLPDFKKQEEIEKKVEIVRERNNYDFRLFISQNFNQIKEQFSELKNISKFFSSELEYYSASTTPENPATTTLDFAEGEVPNTEEEL